MNLAEGPDPVLTMPWIVWVGALAIGSVIGSFLNVGQTRELLHVLPNDLIETCALLRSEFSGFFHKFFVSRKCNIHNIHPHTHMCMILFIFLIV